MAISIIKILLVLVLLSLFLWATTSLARREILSPEWLRKIVHSGLGLVCATFPWIFNNTRELVFLCLGVLLLLLSARYIPAVKRYIGGGLYRIKRRSAGDLLFAIAVVLLFHFGQDNRALYVLPLLILTLSDSVAALVGTRFGRHSFSITGGQKSWEGCAAFFVMTMMLSLLVLRVLTSLEWAHLMVIACILSLIGSMVEAVSWHGWDNLFVPLGMSLLLSSLIESPVSALLMALLILLLVILCLRKLSRFTPLSTHALMGALLAAYFFWETGGLNWLLPPVIVFAIHVMLSSLQGIKTDENYRIAAVISIVATGVFWQFIDISYSVRYAYYAFIVSTAIHVQIMILLRIRGQQGAASQYPQVILVALLSLWLFTPPLILTYFPFSREHLVTLGFGFFIMATGGILLQIKNSDAASLERWKVQGAYALFGSVLSLLPVLLYSFP